MTQLGVEKRNKNLPEEFRGEPGFIRDAHLIEQFTIVVVIVASCASAMFFFSLATVVVYEGPAWIKALLPSRDFHFFFDSLSFDS